MKQRYPGIVIVIVGLLTWSNVSVAEGSNAAKAAAKSIDILHQQKVAARDGNQLAVTVWKPSELNGRHATVLVATPYGSDEAHTRARKYASRGYAMASLDLRGRGGSDGEFIPLSDHGTDICDTIAWIKKQSWSSGEVLMRGGSYRGMAQWMAASTCPQEIDSMVPTASVYPGHDFPIVSGHRSQKYTAAWLGFVSGSASNLNFFANTRYWQQREKLSYEKHIPFNEYDAFVGAPSRHFQAWVERLSKPSSWMSHALIPEKYASMEMPILTITGHYDGDQPGALRYYREHQKSAPKSAAHTHYLVIGPWDHGGTRVPRQKLADDVEFGPAAVFDMDQFNMDWFDWRLGRGPKPELLQSKVAYYVGGAEKWRHANSLDSIADERRQFYLSAASDEAFDTFHSGYLIGAPVSGEQPHQFINNPLDVRFAELAEIDWNAIRDGALRATVPAYMPETLVFHSAPMEENVTLAGQMSLKLYLEMDTPDADVFVTVYAIFPDGSPLYLGGDVVRARFRNGLEPELVQAGVVQAYKFDNFLWNSWKLPAGSRLRLTVGPYNDPSAQKNYNSGGKLGYETKDDARVATINLHHNTKYPSVLELPIIVE